MNTPPSLRAFIAGVSGSGKSRASWVHYLSRYPRRILLDQTGEWEEGGTNHLQGWYPKPDATVFDVDELAKTIQALASRGKWTITVAMGVDDEEIQDLTDYLIPVPHIRRSPIYAVGGAVLLMDEVDLAAPPRGLKREVRTLWRRSRHAGLSIVSTTQRPEAVSREVSSQSNHILCLHLTEPAAFRYMTGLMGVPLEDALNEWTAKNPHGGLWRSREGRILWLAESGRFLPARFQRPARPAEYDDDDDEQPAESSQQRPATLQDDRQAPPPDQDTRQQEQRDQRQVSEDS